MVVSSVKANGSENESATDTDNGWLEAGVGPTGTSTCRIEMVPVHADTR